MSVITEYGEGVIIDTHEMEDETIYFFKMDGKTYGVERVEKDLQFWIAEEGE
jgi:hypothetical protein